ncbi:MAG: hypothetical protein OHK0045_25060 [Raineya sp.]
MKSIASLILLSLLLLEVSFAQDTTQVEPEVPADTSKIQIETTWETDEQKDKDKRKNKGNTEEGFKLAAKAYYQEGDSAFIRKVKENIAYPAEARQLKFKATLIVKFLVRRDSTVGEVQVIDGFAEDTPPEFRRQIEDIINNAVLVASPQGAWIAAQNNQKQAVAMTKKIPIVFVPHKEEE